MENKFDTMADLAVSNYNNFIWSHSSGITAPTYVINSLEDKYSRYDIIQYRTTPYSSTTDIVELKGRYVGFYRFRDCEIDNDKVVELQRIGRESNIPVWVCALYYLSDKVVIWKVDPNKHYETRWRLANKHTAERDIKVWKEVVPFLYDQGYKYSYTFNPEDKEKALKYAEELYGKN